MATSLLAPKTLAPYVPPFDIVGQLWKTVVTLSEQEDILQAKVARIELNFANIDASLELLKLDQSNLSKVTTEVGSITQNSTSFGKLSLSLPSKLNISKNTPLWILALDGVPSQGYQAALTYSCVENANGMTKEALSIISRNTTLPQGIIEKYLVAAATLGFDFECDPFILANQDPNCATLFSEQNI